MVLEPTYLWIRLTSVKEVMCPGVAEELVAVFRGQREKVPVGVSSVQSGDLCGLLTV